jgi:hypothetical protein
MVQKVTVMFIDGSYEDVEGAEDIEVENGFVQFKDKNGYDIVWYKSERIKKLIFSTNVDSD